LSRLRIDGRREACVFEIILQSPVKLFLFGADCDTHNNVEIGRPDVFLDVDWRSPDEEAGSHSSNKEDPASPRADFGKDGAEGLLTRFERLRRVDVLAVVLRHWKRSPFRVSSVQRPVSCRDP
jgi:hypothetical protein